MKQAATKALAWLGLGDDEEGPRVTLEDKRQAGTILLALICWALTYALFATEMPADDGFGGYIPLILASSVAANVVLLAGWWRR